MLIASEFFEPFHDELVIDWDPNEEHKNAKHPEGGSWNLEASHVSADAIGICGSQGKENQRDQFWKEVSNLYYLCRDFCTDICLVEDQVLRVKYLDQDSYGKVNIKINAKVRSEV